MTTGDEPTPGTGDNLPADQPAAGADRPDPARTTQDPAPTPGPALTTPESAPTTPDPAATTPEPSWATPKVPEGWTAVQDGAPDYDVTAPVEVMAVEPKRRPWMLIGTAAGVALAVLVGGVVFAAAKLSGGGTQPEQLVPATALAFAKIDLDPAAGQKLAVREFFGHFPDAADRLGENDDIRELTLSQMIKDAGLDYVEDVEPWLGNRFAVAALPGPAGSEPDVAIYVQVSDEDQAAKVLPDLLGGGGAEPAAVAFRDGYGIGSPSQESLDRVLDAADEATLGSDAEFQADMSDLGGDEVAAAWVDFGAVLDAVAGSVPGGFGVLPPDQQATLADFQGRMAITARFADDYAEIFGRITGSDVSTGLDPGAASVGPIMRNLPPSTGAAIAFSNGGSAFEQGFEQGFNSALAGAGAEGERVAAVIADLEQRYGLRIPEDLLTLLGEQTLVALDLGAVQAGLPLFGMRAVTDAAAAEEIVKKVISMLEFEFGIDTTSLPLHWTGAGDSFYLTGDPGFTDALQQGGAVADPAFETALPDLDTAQVALWVDVDGLVGGVPLFDDDTADQVASHLAGIGMTGSYDDGGATFRLRVVAD